jgi:hypothetical protein
MWPSAAAAAWAPGAMRSVVSMVMLNMEWDLLLSWGRQFHGWPEIA